MTAQTRRWLSEPLLAATIALTAYVAWAVVYSIRLASTGVEPAGAAGSGGNVLVLLLIGIGWVLLPLGAWLLVAVILNRVFRASEVWKRLLMSFVAAAVVCAPFAVFAFVGLARNDGWRGLGVIGLFVPLVAPALAVGLHLLALPGVYLLSRRQHATSQLGS